MLRFPVTAYRYIKVLTIPSQAYWVDKNRFRCNEQNQSFSKRLEGKGFFLKNNDLSDLFRIFSPTVASNIVTKKRSRKKNNYILVYRRKKTKRKDPEDKRILLNVIVTCK